MQSKHQAHVPDGHDEEPQRAVPEPRPERAPALVLGAGIDHETVPLSDGDPGPSKPDRLLDGHWALVLYHRHGADVVLLAPDKRVVVGREPPADVLVPEPSLSREHALFIHAGSSVTVEDLRSRNGMWVRGERVQRADVRPGDEVRLGHVTVSIHPAPGAGALGLDSHEGFRLALEQEFLRARHFGRPLALLIVRSTRQVEAHVSRWSGRVRDLLRPVDRIGLYSADTLEVLLPETDPTTAGEFAEAIARAPDPQAPALIVGVATFPDAAGAADPLIELGRAACQSASPEHPVRAARTGAWEPADSDKFDAHIEPVVVSRAMREVFDQVVRLAQSPIPVLILGETGTGKEVVARALHEKSRRRDKSMINLNCGAIPSQIVEGTLFGHERGAFTGAAEQRKGVFEAANGGTLFLDEIGELSLAAQAALLRVLETKRVMRVGSTKEIEVDVRVVSATNQDLEAMCVQGAFRRDLLYRLNIMILTLPPLRARPDEIAPLAQRFLSRANRANGRRIQSVRHDAAILLKGYSWPGNVRELRSVIERAVVIAQGDEITPHDLPDPLRAERSVPLAARLAAPQASPPVRPGVANVKDRLHAYEAEMILEALREAGGNQTVAAHRLQMPLRTLVRKIGLLGLRDKG